MPVYLMFFACSSEDSEDVSTVQEATISVEEVQLSDEADLISEELINIAEDVYTASEISAISRNPFNSDFIPDCATITTVETDNSIEKTIVFEDDCELPNGNIVSGTLTLSFERNFEALTKTINFSLENFVFNGVAVEGSSSIERTRQNENGNPQSVAQASFDATWPDETTASFSGTRTREWIEGSDTPFWGDNVFLITGNRTFINRQGTNFQKEIIEPLRRELACRFIVSGILEITRGDATATLDFGDGDCDSVGTLTTADGSREINLRRFR